MLDNKRLSIKLASLLCLISCRRVSDVKALEIHNRSYDAFGVRFEITKRTKTMSDMIFYPRFDACKKLCVVDCMKEYDSRMDPRRTAGVNQLLISFVKPFKPVSSSSIARWVKLGMQFAGIDLLRFQPHSLRGAMASQSFWKGGKLDDILKAADWSSSYTFAKHYCKPIEHMSDVVLLNYQHA